MFGHQVGLNGDLKPKLTTRVFALTDTPPRTTLCYSTPIRWIGSPRERYLSTCPRLDQLLQRSALRDQLDHLELEQVDVAVEQYRHVDTPTVGHVFQADVQAQRGEVAVEHTGPVARVLGDGVVALPVVGDAGEEGFEQPAQAGEVVGQQAVVKLRQVRGGRPGDTWGDCSPCALAKSPAGSLQRGFSVTAHST